MSDLDTHFRRNDAPAVVILPLQAQAEHNIRKAVLGRIRVAPGQAALSRMLGRGCHVVLPSLNAAFAVHLVADAPQAEWTGALVLDGPDGPVEIEEGMRLLRALTGVDAGMAADMQEGQWEWLQSALLGRLGNTPFESCERIVRGPQPAFSEPAVLRVVLRSGRHQLATRLRANISTWLNFLPRTAWSRDRQPLSAYLALTTQTTVRIARHDLPASALRSLAEGDIILPDSPRFSPDGQGWVSFEACRVRVCFLPPGTLRVLAVTWHGQAGEPIDSDAGEAPRHRKRNHSSEEKSMDDENDGRKKTTKNAGGNVPGAPPVRSEDGSIGEPPAQRAASPDAGADGKLDMVNVTLHFELGKVQMSLGELGTLDAGSILLFGDGSPQSVAIVASDRTLGRGEVVDVDGRLGIRVTQWGREGE